MSDDKFFSPNEFCRLVLNNLVDYSIFTTDNELAINCWYTGAARLFGYEAEEVIGRSSELLFTDEDRKNGIALLEKETTLKEGKDGQTTTGGMCLKTATCFMLMD